MKTVGITGGIGSGKTTVANFFKALGVPLYIADIEAKKLMVSPRIKLKIIELLGEKSYDNAGNLDRKYIANQVFTNKNLLNQLNQIVHPAVEKHFQQWIKQQNAPYVLYEAAILFETGKYTAFDYTILVTASEKDRLDRLLKRDHSTPEEIQARMNNQWSDTRKKELADWVICNRHLADTQEEVQKIHALLLKL